MARMENKIKMWRKEQNRTEQEISKLSGAQIAEEERRAVESALNIPGVLCLNFAPWSVKDSHRSETCSIS